MAASDHLENVVASSGDFVANGNLIFSAGNGFLKLLLARAEERYTGQGWNSLGGPISYYSLILNTSAGPVLLTEAIMDFCKVGRQTGLPIIGHHTNCWNLSVFNYPAFYPLKANQREQLFESGEDSHWKKLFKDSYGVHFFGQLTSTRYWMGSPGFHLKFFFVFVGNGGLETTQPMTSWARCFVLSPTMCREIWIYAEYFLNHLSCNCGSYKMLFQNLTVNTFFFYFLDLIFESLIFQTLFI